MGSSVISVGLRHVKVWRVEHVAPSSPSKFRLEVDEKPTTPTAGPGPRTLIGRNCLLGSLLDASFTCVTAISDVQAIVCTSQGDLCLLDDAGKSQKLMKVTRVPFSIHCVYFEKARGLVWVGGGACSVKAFPVTNLTTPNNTRTVNGLSVATSQSIRTGSREDCSLVALGGVRNQIIAIDSEKHIVFKSDNGRDIMSQDQKMLPAHDRAVLGACPLVNYSHWPGSDFLTYSSNGVVLYWLSSGECVGRTNIAMEKMLDFEAEDVNELRVLLVPIFADLLVTGDKKGVIRCVDVCKTAAKELTLTLMKGCPIVLVTVSSAAKHIIAISRV